MKRATFLSRQVLDVPYFEQKERHHCGPAVCQMMLAYYGHAVSQQELIEILEPDVERGAEEEHIEQIFSRYGLRGRGQPHSELQDIYSTIDRGNPVIVGFMKQEPQYAEGHYAVVVGYSDTELIMHDPWDGPHIAVPIVLFYPNWYGESGRYQRWMCAVQREN